MAKNWYKISLFILLTTLVFLYFGKIGHTDEEKGSLVDKYFKDEKSLKDDEKIADCPFCRRTIKIDNEGNLTKFKEDKYQVEKFIIEAIQGIRIEYKKGSSAFVKGRKNTKPIYEQQYGQKKLKGYSVDSNIYLAQEYFKMFKNRFEAIIEQEEEEKDVDENLDFPDKKAKEIIDLLLKAANERVQSIVLESRGYYTKEKAYKGEWERATAKANIADFCVSSALAKLGKYIEKQNIDEWVEKYKIKEKISDMKIMFGSGKKVKITRKAEE